MFVSHTNPATPFTIYHSPHTPLNRLQEAKKSKINARERKAHFFPSSCLAAIFFSFFICGSSLVAWFLILSFFLVISIHTQLYMQTLTCTKLLDMRCNLVLLSIHTYTRIQAIHALSFFLHFVIKIYVCGCVCVNTLILLLFLRRSSDPHIGLLLYCHEVPSQRPSIPLFNSSNLLGRTTPAPALLASFTTTTWGGSTTTAEGEIGKMSVFGVVCVTR